MRMPTFDFQYRGMTFVQLLQSENHAVLKAKTKLSDNGLGDEYEAARSSNRVADITMSIPAAQNWFALPRPTRAAIVAQMHIKNVSDAIRQLDTHDYWQAFWEARNRQRGGR